MKYWDLLTEVERLWKKKCIVKAIVIGDLRAI